MSALEDVKWKTSRIATVLTSDFPAPRFVSIETARQAGGCRGESSGERLVAHERSEPYRPLGSAGLSGPRQDGWSSGEQHSDLGPVRTPIQVHGIDAGQKFQRSPVNARLGAGFLLHCPCAFAALSSKVVADSHGSRAVPHREDHPDFVIHELYSFNRRRTEDGICTLSSSSLVIERTHAMSLRLSSSSGLRVVSSRVATISGGTGSFCSRNQSLKYFTTSFFR